MAPLLSESRGNPSSLSESRNKDPRLSSLSLHSESAYRGSPIDLQETRIGTACSASRPLIVGGAICWPLKRLNILASVCQNRNEYYFELYMTSPQSRYRGIMHSTRVAADIARATVTRRRWRSCRIESPDRKLAPRQRTSFVAIHDRKPLSHVGKNGSEYLRPLWPRPCVVQDADCKRLQ